MTNRPTNTLADVLAFFALMVLLVVAVISGLASWMVG